MWCNPKKQKPHCLSWQLHVSINGSLNFRFASELFLCRTASSKQRLGTNAMKAMQLDNTAQMPFDQQPVSVQDQMLLQVLGGGQHCKPDSGQSIHIVCTVKKQAGKTTSGRVC